MGRYKRNKVQNAMATGNVEPAPVYVYTEEGERALKSWFDAMTEKYHFTRAEMDEFLKIKCHDDYVEHLKEKGINRKLGYRTGMAL